MLLGVERLRTQVAVSVASCRRFTSKPLWHRYFELESRVRRALKALKSASSPAITAPARCELLETLARPVPASDGMRSDAEAIQLCDRLDEVVRLLEKGHESRC